METYDKIEKHLFDNKETALQYLTPTQYEVKKRLMITVTKILDNPIYLDKEMVEFIENGCGGKCKTVSKSQAYRDMKAIKKYVGSIELYAKNWYRYLIIEGAKKAYIIAESQKDSKGMAAALDKIGKYTRADKEDDNFDYSQMIPPAFEPSDDAKLLENIKQIENLEEKRKQFREIFKSRMLQNAQTIQYDEQEPMG